LSTCDSVLTTVRLVLNSEKVLRSALASLHFLQSSQNAQIPTHQPTPYRPHLQILCWLLLEFSISTSFFLPISSFRPHLQLLCWLLSTPSNQPILFNSIVIHHIHRSHTTQVLQPQIDLTNTTTQDCFEFSIQHHVGSTSSDDHFGSLPA